MRPLPLTLMLLVALGCGARSEAVVFGSWQPTVHATPDIAALEKQMFERVNADRTGAGLPRLAWDARLADVARAHSHDMRENHFFAHESPRTGTLADRLDRAGYLAAEMRENLATATSVESAEDNLLASPHHLENLMAPSVTHLGVGIVRGDGNGDARMFTFTQVFSQPVVLDTPERAAADLAQRLDQARAERGLSPLQRHPVLAELAAAHVGELPDDVSPQALDEQGDAIASDLGKRRGHGVASLSLVAQATFSTRLMPIPAAAYDDEIRFVGIAAVPARDERGRPKVKVLVLLGR